jgi:predicted RNase H-like HicB family nuclease
MSKIPSLKFTNLISIAFETNGKGYIGYLVELPGAFIRGKTEEGAISKLRQEVNLYLKWLGIKQKLDYKIQVVQRHQSALAVEDADNEILLDTDRDTMVEEEFRNLLDLVWYSGETFLQLYNKTRFKDWVDELRIRKTFYGENPKTIQEIFDHVKGCHYYYLSRTKITFDKKEEDFIKIREFCIEKIEKLYLVNNNSLIFNVENELWTIKKILRRFIWHDRVHAKAMTRILEKQKELGMIAEYDDPFHFMEGRS